MFSLFRHQFLCGPLNTNRLTRKSNSRHVANYSSNFKDLYGASDPIKPPWNEDAEKSRESDAMSCNFSETFVQNLAPYLQQMDDFRVSVQQYVVSSVNEPPDGTVPDSVHVDAQESCPLFDSSEYERDERAEKLNTQFSDELPSPKRDRYRLYVGDELSRYIDTDDGCLPTEVPFKSSTTCKPKNRVSYCDKSKADAGSSSKFYLFLQEDVLVSLLTSPNGQDISVTDSHSH